LDHVIGLLKLRDWSSDKEPSTNDLTIFVPLHPTPLINISTGMHASREVQDSLLNCVEQGTKMVKSFVDGSLSEDQSRSFNNPITGLLNQ
jgi:hypothetical protein